MSTYSYSSLLRVDAFLRNKLLLPPFYEKVNVIYLGILRHYDAFKENSPVFRSSRKGRNFLEKDGCFNFLNALASI